MDLLLEKVDESLLRPSVNALRLSLHPKGAARRILNLGDWHAHILGRLRHEYGVTGDPTLAKLLDELAAYPVPVDARAFEANDVAVPLRIAWTVRLYEHDNGVWPSAGRHPCRTDVGNFFPGR